ncbi:MAG: hypothetical protein LBG58_14215 [Planctomycetaceae bacterium]|nr:hypothetical protein [Planctomycetaceae bacterium]
MTNSTLMSSRGSQIKPATGSQLKSSSRSKYATPKIIFKCGLQFQIAMKRKGNRNALSLSTLKSPLYCAAHPRSNINLLRITGLIQWKSKPVVYSGFFIE